ncbi:MAG: hypothetical protein V8S24_06375 [Gordonibacter pamelaeae]
MARQKQGELDRKYYNPPTPQYKRLRKIWWALLIGAIARRRCRGSAVRGSRTR